MGKLLLGLENLALWLLLVAVCLALLARLKNRRLRVVLAVLLCAVPVLFYGLLIALDVALRIYLYTPDLALGRYLNVQASWVSAIALLMLSFVVGAAVLLKRGLRTAETDSADAPGGAALPAARHWPLGRLLVALFVVVILHVMTFANLDAAARQHLDVLRSEAYALAMSAAPEPLADSENAAVEYLQVYEVLGRGEPPYQKTSPEWPQLWLDATDALEPVSNEAGETPPFDFAAPELARWLAGRQGEIQLLRQAAAKPGCNFDRNYGAINWAVLLPEVQNMRRAVMLLAVDARHRAATGDLSGALADIDAIYGAARHITREPFGVSMLVAAALEGLAFDTLQAVLQAANDAPDEALAAVRTHQERSYRRDMRRILRAEEAMIINSAINLDDTLQDFGLVGYDSFWARPQGAIYRVFLLGQDMGGLPSALRDVERLARWPYEATKEALKQFDAPDHNASLGISAENQYRQLDNAFQADARRRVAHVALAMHRYRARHGKFSERLAELTPEVIPVLPTDPYDLDQPIRLEKNDRGWAVYSIGPDQKDDRGAAWNYENKTGDIGIRYEPNEPASETAKDGGESE